jgi:uncharacterized protein YndB with AHSA1/START domain
MKWVLIGLGALAVLAAVVMVAGSLISRTHRVSSRATLAQPPHAVWAAVRDLGALPTFWKDLTRSERLPDREGREAWTHTMKSGFAMALVVVEEDPPRRLVTEIAAPPGSPFGGKWIYQLAATPGGTEVTVTEDGWIANPIFRVVSRITGYHGSLDSYLRALGGRFGETVRPLHLP